MNEKIFSISMEKIVANCILKRRHENEGYQNNLKKSIERNGLKEPIIVRPKGGKFEIVDGHRRYEACKSLGYKKIKCKINKCSDAETIDDAIARNEMGENYNIVDLGRVCIERMKLYYWEHPNAKKAGGNKSKQTEDTFVVWYSEQTGLNGWKIRQAIRICKNLDENVKRRIVSGANIGTQNLRGVSAETADVIARIRNKKVQNKICNVAIKENMVREDVARIVEAYENGEDVNSAINNIESSKFYQKSREGAKSLKEILDSLNIVLLTKMEVEGLLPLLQELQEVMDRVVSTLEKRKKQFPS